MKKVTSRAVEGMYTTLARLKIYRLRQGSMIDAELAAYSAGFARLERMLERMEGRAFVQTASGDELHDHERLVGLFENSHLSDEERRQLVIDRMSLAPSMFKVTDIDHILRAVGIRALVTEHIFQESLQLRIYEYIDPWLDLDLVRSRLETMLPAHLVWEFNYGTLTWNLLEEHVNSWDQWDGADFTWNQFDHDGHTIFT